MNGGPFFVTWSPTMRCTRRCAHCTVGVLPPYAPADELSTRDAHRIVDVIAENHGYILNFSGGEVLLRPDFFDLAAHARSLGLAVLASTNGDLVDEGVARRLAEIGFECFQVSIDGASEISHDAVRGPGSFRRARAALRAIRDAGIAPVLATAIHRGNRSELAELVDLAVAEGVEIFKLQTVISAPMSLTHRGLSVEDAIAVVEETARLLDGSGIALSAPLWYGIAKATSFDPYCAFDGKRAAIDVLGRMTLCEDEPGNASSDVLHDGYLHSWQRELSARRANGRCACTALIDRARASMARAAA